MFIYNDCLLLYLRTYQMITYPENSITYHCASMFYSMPAKEWHQNANGASLGSTM